MRKALLEGHPFAEGLSEEHLDFLSGISEDRICARGDYLCRDGKPADAFYLLREGRVALEVHVVRRTGLRIETIHPGDVLGWSWMMPPYRWRLDARALEPVRAVAIDAAALRRRCDADHELGYQVLRRMAHLIGHRLQRTRAHLLELHGRSRRGASVVPGP